MAQRDHDGAGPGFGVAWHCADWRLGPVRPAQRWIHSEGGWVALRLCARLAAPRHLIINSCPAVSFAESEAYALTRAGAEQDQAPALIHH
jgi:hypothetical protein